ncbi:hypothetical protein J4217_03620 [Candidatus Pacearchaeota archaeon]|nr:hypothetical protein [uncultured archaeon]MBS3091507.1 hypothetical protein [Candidatus Pacearchaeota archaeon]
MQKYEGFVHIINYNLLALIPSINISSTVFCDYPGRAEQLRQTPPNRKIIIQYLDERTKSHRITIPAGDFFQSLGLDFRTIIGRPKIYLCNSIDDLFNKATGTD